MITHQKLINYFSLKILTEKISPLSKLRGTRGRIGKKGRSGPNGEMGERGPKAEQQDRGDPGEKGLKGENSECQRQDEYVDDLTGIIKGGCSSENNDWNMMALTSYNARNKIGCLFGYKLENGICKSPINGSVSKVNNLEKFGIKNWQPKNSSNLNCSYNKDVISNLKAPQFKKWAELMSGRNCPGVPINGTVPGAEKGDIANFENNNYEYCKNNNVYFFNCSDCTLSQHQQVCSNSKMKVASAGQVEQAYNRCGLDKSKHGRISDGRFAYPVKEDSGIYKAGPNINAYDGNDGVFCISNNSKDAEQQTKSLVAPTPSEVPSATQAPTPAPNQKRIYLLKVNSIMDPPEGSTWPDSIEEITKYGGEAKVFAFVRYEKPNHSNDGSCSNCKNGPSLVPSTGTTDERLMGQATTRMLVKAPDNWQPPSSDIKIVKKGELFTDKTCSIEFVGTPQTSLSLAKKECESKNKKLASPQEVYNATEYCGLNTFAYGRMSNNSYSVPIWKGKKPWFNVNGGNQGQFCIDKSFTENS